VFTSVLWQFRIKFAPLTCVFGVPHVNRGDTPESGWIHLKVGIQWVLFSVGISKTSCMKTLRLYKSDCRYLSTIDIFLDFNLCSEKTCDEWHQSLLYYRKLLQIVLKQIHLLSFFSIKYTFYLLGHFFCTWNLTKIKWQWKAIKPSRSTWTQCNIVNDFITF